MLRNDPEKDLFVYKMQILIAVTSFFLSTLNTLLHTHFSMHVVLNILNSLIMEYKSTAQHILDFIYKHIHLLAGEMDSVRLCCYFTV